MLTPEEMEQRDRDYENGPSPIYGYCLCDHCKRWREEEGAKTDQLESSKVV